jgi:nicotinamide-nucleotide amidase
MKVEVVAIGTELLLGQIVDTNSSWIGEQLALAGLDSHYQTKVGDNPARMESALRLALSRSDAVICCGGLGPTQDDVTRDVIAAVMGVELVHDEAVAARIEEMFRSRNRPMSANNLLQAKVPVGATTMAQQPGTAPGLVCPIPGPGSPGASGAGEGPGQVIYAVPGVPHEMREMVLGTVVPDLIARSGRSDVIRSRVLRTWGLSESALSELLADRIDQLDQLAHGDQDDGQAGPQAVPTLAFLASGVEGLKVRITVKAADEAQATEVLDREEKVVRDLLGDIVFGLDGDNMEAVVVALLAERSLTVAVAESLTGGYVAGRICAVPGASAVFRGGVVAYQPDVKRDLLGVPPGPVVTEDAALAMARGVRATLGADVGLATTGVAGPDPAEGLPVGTVCLAVVGPDGEASVQVRLPGDRERIRQYSAITLLNLLRQQLLG